MSGSEGSNPRECAWVSAGLSRRYERLVRVWEPGDGLKCSLRNFGNNRGRCGEPVAVEKSVFAAEPHRFGRWDKSSVTRVLCLNHLAAQFMDAGAAAVEVDVERSAQEAVCKAHFAEFEAELERAKRRAYESRLSALPEDLREKVISRIAECGDQR